MSYHPCTCGSDYHPRYRAAHVISRPDKQRNRPTEVATAWIAEMRSGQAVRA